MGDLLVESVRRDVFPFFIRPVCRNPELSDEMHVFRPNLDFERLTFRSNHCRMERLIHVRLRHSDIIFETSRHRLVLGVDDSEHGITITNRIDDNADRHQIVNFIELFFMLHHLVIDRIDVLRSTVHVGIDMHFLKNPVHFRDDRGDECFPFRPFLFHHRDDLIVLLRVDIT